MGPGSLCVGTYHKYVWPQLHTVSHFSYAPLFQGPHFLTENAGIEHSL